MSQHCRYCVQAYEEYFRYLDQTGGFFYERWGDAPVHSLGAVMLLNSSQVNLIRISKQKRRPTQTLKLKPFALPMSNCWAQGLCVLIMSHSGTLQMYCINCAVLYRLCELCARMFCR